jgi:amidophosphoribosyltransferase
MARQTAGKLLAARHPVEADMVMGVPDTGLDAAIGYSAASGIPYGIGFIKNRYVGRTFIQDTQAVRESAVHIKLNPVSSAVKGKRVILIDDSIVRGTTCKRIIDLLRNAGAKSVHMRISSPPFLHPCYFGTDISSRDKLIACRMTIEEIRKEIGADTLGYLEIEDMKNIAPESKCGFCYGCFTGEYPVDPPDEVPDDKYSHKIIS